MTGHDHDDYLDPATGEPLPGLDRATRAGLDALGPLPADPADQEAWTLRRLALLVPVAEEIPRSTGERAVPRMVARPLSD